jgi:hypothetical protein
MIHEFYVSCYQQNRISKPAYWGWLIGFQIKVVQG